MNTCKYLFVAFFTLSTTFCWAQDEAPARKSLIPNGDFEVVSDDWPPPGWEVWGNAQDQKRENIHVDATNPRAGKACLRIHHPANTHAYPVTARTGAVKTAKGKAYLVSFWARLDDPGEPGVFYFEAATKLDPWKDAPSPGRWPIKAGKDWTQFNFEIHEGKDFIADEAAYILLAFRPTRGKGAAQTMWIDEVVVSEVESTAEPLIDPRTLQPEPLRHRLGAGERLLLMVDADKQIGPSTPQAGGVSFHRIGGGGRHPYDYDGNYVLEPQLLEALRQMKLPMTRFYGVGDHRFPVTEAIDKIADLGTKCGIPLDWVVLELEPVGAGKTLTPAQWAAAVKHSVDKGYKFRFWEIANEPYTRKATAFNSPDEYAEHLIAVSKAIRKVQGDARIGVGIHSTTQGWGNYLLKKAAGFYDFVVAHHYDDTNPYTNDFEFVALCANYKKLHHILRVNALIRQYNPGRDVYQLDTEWGLHAPRPGAGEDDPTRWWRNSNICGAMYRAVRMIYYAREGMLRGASGWEMFARKHYTTFAFLTREAPDKRFMLYWLYYYFNHHVGPIALDFQGTAPYYHPVSDEIDQKLVGPLTPTLITLSADGSRMYFVIANGSWDRDIPCEASLQNFQAGSATGVVLSQSDKDADPLVDKRQDVVGDLPIGLGTDEMSLTVPARSVVFITVDAK